MNWRSFPWFRSFLVVFFFALGCTGIAFPFGSVICVLISGLVLGHMALPWFTLPAVRFVDLLYFGDNNNSRPPQTLRLAHAYLAANRWEDAAMECERQLEWHRESPELWACLVHAGQGEGDARALQQIYKRARLRLRHSPEALEKFEALTKAGPPRIPTGKSFLWQS